jgi:ceramide glucosyltransferase
MKTLVLLFEGLTSLLLLQSIAAWVATLRLVHYTLRYPTCDPGAGSAYQPRATIFVPCKGLDPEWEENLQPLFEQDYPDYELVFVTESVTDPAHEVLTRMIQESARPAWLLVAGETRIRGQKIHNLCAAVEMLDAIDRRTEVLVFADADARTRKRWLSEMVAPLGDKRIGATTGFRWFLSAAGSETAGGHGWGERMTATFLSIWNSAALPLLGERSRFAWGGAMAIRRENFERLQIRRRWEGALSDDYMLTGAIHEARQRIRFVPTALLASPARLHWKDLLEFTTRQIRITRIYSPVVWKVGLATHTFFVTSFWGGLLLLSLLGSFSPRLGQAASLPTLLMVIYLLGGLNGLSRSLLARHLLHNPTGEGGDKRVRIGWPSTLAHGLLSPLVSLFYLYNFLSSRLTRRIVWRGIDYEMISPTETIVRRRVAAPATQERSEPNSSHA